MALPSKPLIFLLLSFLPFSSQTCSNYTFSSNQPFTSCADLPHLNASLFWTRSLSSAVCVAYKAPQAADGWVAWGINPTSTSMVGSQAIVAFRHSNGSLVAYPTPLTSYSPSMKPEKLSFPVYNVSAEYVNGEMIIFATLGLLGGGGGSGGSKYNQVWQEGSVLNDVPQAHSTTGENILSMGSVEFH